VVGTGAEFGGSSLAGDLFTLAAVCCWAIYTVGSRPLLARYSPLTVTAITMFAGTALYAPASAAQLAQADWGRVPGWAWASMVLSAVLALNVAYLIWYTSVQRIGNIRTSAYSNLIPIVAIAVATVALGEAITARKLAGAGAILVGVGITRMATRTRGSEPPAEE
jgi:drug/metabolite transporter (DMT)-like permease